MKNRQHALRPWLQLLGALLVITVIWLGVLPKLARTQTVQQHLQILDEHHVDASAMFYTELDAQLLPGFVAE